MMDVTSELYRLIALVLFAFAGRTVYGDGTFAVRFDHYSNPSGNAGNGHCCDGKWGICQNSGCDYLFTICLDNGNHADSMYQCEFGKLQSQRVKNVNSVDFGDYISDLDNPMLFRFTGGFIENLVLKIEVYDKDNEFTENDFVDFLRVTIPLDHGSYRNGAVFKDFVAYGTRAQDKTSMTGEVAVQCDPSWYSSDCSRYCRPPAHNDHYRCDSSTGNKVCTDGFTGPNCTIAATPATMTTTRRYTTTRRHTTTTTTTTVAPTTTEGQVIFVDRENADCDNLARSGYRYLDGVYTLRVSYFPVFEAYCDMSAEGWTVIQRRNTGLLDFDRTWDEYVTGFGEIGALDEYWLGLEKIYWLTNQRPYKLRVTMQIGNGEFRYAEYENFFIEGRSNNYRLHVSGYSGTAGDSLRYDGYGGMRKHDGQPFSTADRDHDNWHGGSCAQAYHSGWWFNDCYWANLNGVYVEQTNGWPLCHQDHCVAWMSIPNYEDYSLLKTEMEILPN